MSQIRVNEVVSENALSAPHFPFGATGIDSASDTQYANVAGIATYASTAGIATSADGLETARTIGLSGDATGSGSFDGTGDLTIVVDVNTSTYADTAGIATNAQGLSGAPDISVGVITATKGVDIRSNTLTDTTTFRYQYQYVDGDGEPRVESVSFDRVQVGPINSDNSPNTSLVTAGAVLNSTVAAAQGLSGTPDITVGTITANQGIRVGSGQSIGSTGSEEDVVYYGDGSGLTLTSPNGTAYRLVVANDGTLSTAAV